jgi:hypothetical protein
LFPISFLVFFISVGEVKGGQDGLENNLDGIYNSGNYISLGKQLDYLEDKEEITRKFYDGRYRHWQLRHELSRCVSG